MSIFEMMNLAIEKKASDLHITVNMPPILRIFGELVRQDYADLTPGETESMSRELMNEKQYNIFSELGEMDFSYSLPGRGRFRINAFRRCGTTSIVLRSITDSVPSPDELNLPAALLNFTKKTKGLFLVTGPTGSGKSTTLASMLDIINSERACHIITLEDPIEFMHSHKKCIVNQREVGQDTQSFGNALRAALRQDPDVILVGEMRDLETIGITITAAETGHLVFATLHTINAPQTVDRIIDVFPPYQQQQIKMQLSNSLIGVLSQQLVKHRSGEGRVPATELMVVNPAVRNLIREGKTHQLYSVIQTGGKLGMQTMDDQLRKLYQDGQISYDDALAYAVDSEAMLRHLGFAANLN
ncbi:MAG: type IV pilus twitching motility protein PilT [Dethiobacter sp.]|nr:type IV pilus twitching motility protein PilT [Dethiobacter sp.]